VRIPAILLTVAALAACGGSDDSAPPAMEEAAPAEAAPTVADFAGSWQSTAVLEGVDDPVAVTLQGSAAGSDWVMMLEDRDPIPLQVSMSGDSLVTVSDPYESVLREGVTVTVRTASVLQDGRLVGSLVATYQTPEGEEVVRGTVEGTRGM
jgi:hypothetical protein